MSGFHVDTASSVSILMKEVVRPSLKNRWQGSHSISRPTRGKKRGEPKREGDKRRNKERRNRGIEEKIKTHEEQTAKKKEEQRNCDEREKEGREEGGESEQWLEQKEEHVEGV